MTDETGAQAPAETTVPAVEPAKVENIPAVEPAAETEPKVEAEAPESEPEGEPEGDDKPKRLPRSQRDKRKISYLAGENARLAQEVAELRTIAERAEKASREDVEPTLEAFNYDVDKFNDAKQRWNVRQEINAFEAKQQQRQISEHQRRLEQNRMEAINERAEEVRSVIPDFDRVLNEYHSEGGSFQQHVKEAIFRVGPELAYYLAKHPDTADELNQLDPIEAAIRIGKLSPKLSLAQSRKQTQAPPPPKALTGGAAATPSIMDLAKSDDLTAYIKARDAEDARRR